MDDQDNLPTSIINYQNIQIFIIGKYIKIKKPSNVQK